MELAFDNTTWKKIKHNNEIMVIYNYADFTYSISMRIYEGDILKLFIIIKDKNSIRSFLNLLHITGVMYSNGHTISDIDRVSFYNEFNTINGNRKEQIWDNSALIDTYASQLYNHGRDLWDLLGQSNLMSLL